MTRDIENTEDERKSNLDFYKDMLKSYIFSSMEQPKISEKDMEKYIATFSLYLCFSNEAYKYNLLYLNNQHKRYVSFLASAPQKAEKLLSIIKYLKTCESIVKLIEQTSSDLEKELTVSLNDFLTANLYEKMDFHKSFSLSGAVREKDKDIITIEYKQKVRVVKLSKEKKSDLDKIATAVEKLSIEI